MTLESRSEGNDGNKPNPGGRHAVFLTQSEAAEFLRVSVRSLERWRLEGIGPPYRRFGRRVVYERDDLLTWADTKVRLSTSEPASDQVEVPGTA